MIDFSKKLREHNLKATPQRLAICKELHRSGHLTINMLYELLLRNFNSLSLATVYKNITLMIENSFVKEIKIPNSKSVYELVKDSHSHLVCQKCGKVEDVDCDLESVMQEVLKEKSFIVNNADLVLSGICKNCQ